MVETSYIAIIALVLLHECSPLTTVDLSPPLVLSKMPETPATAVHPPNGTSKDGSSMLLQQFGRIPNKPQECRSSQDALHSSIGTLAVTGAVSRCSQVLQELLNQQFGAAPATAGLPSL